jgi:NAD(P)-dependent dehydrogenase (short-subunit alcohol dehydrogenase family)
MDIRLERARVLITAGASGIGRAIADAFMAAGAHVYICDKSEANLRAYRRERPEVSGIVADVASPDEVQVLFDSVLSELGGLEVLVNNAGIAGPTAPVEDIDPNEWAETMNVNINGQFHCARLAVPALKKAGSGSIVNISSVAGRLGYPLRTPYAASKWAVVGFTKSLAMELGPSGIRVNAILPGVVAGERIRGVIGARASVLGVSYEEVEARYLGQASLRRMVSAEDIANMVLFLCSNAGANISGQALSVCGNVEVLR